MKSKLLDKRYQLIVFLSFLVVVLAGIKYLYKPDWSNYKTTTILITPTPTYIEKNNDYPLKNILPYIGENFEIVEYEEPLILRVKVKVMDKEAVENEMTALFETQKIDINTHKFNWQEN